MKSRFSIHNDRLFDLVNHLLLAVIVAVTLLPLWFVVVASFSDPNAVNRGEVIFWVRDFDLIGYERVFSNQSLWRGYLNTIVYTVLFMAMTLFLTLPFAYALAHRRFAFRKAFTVLLIITWYFHGGLVPTFLVVRNLGLYNTTAIMGILGALSVWNVIIARTFFKNTIPEELWEAALMDGCNHFTYFFRILIPLSKAIIVVLLLFSAVGQWNDFFKGLIFLKEEKSFPLQLILRSILIQSTSEEILITLEDMQETAERERIAGVIRYVVIILGSLPLLIAYPFFQKYFIQGVMIGSVKG